MLPLIRRKSRNADNGIRMGKFALLLSIPFLVYGISGIIPRHPPEFREFRKSLKPDRIDRFLNAKSPKAMVRTQGGWLWATGKDLASKTNNEALIFIMANDYDRAAEILKQVTQKDRQFFPARFNLGKVYLRIKKHKEALLQFKMARNLVPGYWNNYYYIALSYQRMGDYDAAEHYYKLSYRHNPYHLDSLTALGDLLLEQGRLMDAKKRYLDALRYDDGFNNALIGLGKVELKLRRYYEATLYFRSVDTSKPYNKELHYYYAEAAFFAQMYATAVEQYKLLLQFPQDPIYNKVSVTRIKFRLKQAQKLALQSTQ
ncbi:MAG: hypothetical protein D6767_08750 [Candidatus Hydrogenedentota bacterium]|nr:MAG: hypothetical protein D6767_08750 [Candidatus Hydrogenedentota bacterium]